MSCLAEGTFRATAYCAGKTLLTSEGLGWTSLLVRISEFAAAMDAFETPATPDPRIVLLLNNAGEQATSKKNTREDLSGGHSPASFLQPGDARND